MVCIEVGHVMIEYSTGTVYDVTYYTACPSPYKLPSYTTVWADMLTWMLENYGKCSEVDGPGVWTKGQRWYANNGRLWIRDAEDLIMFKLRWGM